MENITMKERVLRFVEDNGTARFTQIQKFIVDTNYGAGAYDNGHQMEPDAIRDKEGGGWKRVMRKRNKFRGYYCGAFRSVSSGSFGNKLPVGYFMRGADRLEKTADGSYTVIRALSVADRTTLDVLKELTKRFGPTGLSDSGHALVAQLEAKLKGKL